MKPKAKSTEAVSCKPVLGLLFASPGEEVPSVQSAVQEHPPSTEMIGLKPANLKAILLGSEPIQVQT